MLQLLSSTACWYCARPLDRRASRRQRNAIELDHTVPLSRGGANAVANLRAVCKACNAAKRSRTGEEYKERRLRTVGWVVAGLDLAAGLVTFRVRGAPRGMETVTALL